MVYALGLVGAVNTAMLGTNFSFYIAPMSEELGSGVALFGLAQSLRMVAGALAGIIIGRLIDRYGARLPLAIATVLMAVIIVGVSQITAGWQLVVLFAALGMIGMQGPNSLYSSVPIAKWFRRKRGRAMSIAFLGTPVGIAFSTPLAQYLIHELGWRESILVMGLTGAAIVFLIAVFVVRRSPEDMGLPLDGETPGTEQEAPRNDGRRNRRVAALADEYPWTREEALRHPTFWKLALVFGVVMLGVGTIGLYRVPYFIERGVDPQLVSYAMSTDAVASLAISIPLGLLLDHFEPRRVILVGILCFCTAFALVILWSGVWQMFVAFALIGCGYVGVILVQTTIWPEYFGRENLGAIRGAAMPVSMVFQGIASPATGLVRDLTGSYTPAWICGFIALALGAVLISFTPRPQPPLKPDEEAPVQFQGAPSGQPIPERA
jgi:MFS family permease